jgi:hypothetical protein
VGDSGVWTVFVGEVGYVGSLHVSVTEIGRDIVVVDPLMMLDSEVTEEEGRGAGMELEPVMTPPLVFVELAGEYEVGVFGDEDGKKAVDVTPVTQ